MFILNGEDILVLLKSVRNKKVIIYGVGALANEIIQKLQCLDIIVDYCVDDELSSVNVAVEVRDVYSLLLEKDEFYVLIAKKNRKKSASILVGMGLRYYEDFNSVYSARHIHSLVDDYLLDVSLGYTMPLKKTKGDGIRIFGDINNAEYIIAILGGSTSDPSYNPWKSWGECLWEYHPEKWAVVVGAVVGYSSSDEVIKMFRDILPLKPNLIISYSGINDTVQRYPYMNSYQINFYNKLRALKPQVRWGGSEGMDRISYGLRKEMIQEDYWINNQRIMHSVATEFGIEYKVYFQPTLFSKNRGVIDEEVFSYSETRNVLTNCEEFSQKVLKKVKELKLDYIVDATHWLDGVDGVFYDFAHVSEQGNKMIAERVYQDIREGCF